LESEGVKIPDSIRHKYWILIILSFSSKNSNYYYKNKYLNLIAWFKCLTT
jgi:hypothetical protein